MKRPWQVWAVFALCVLGAAGAMTWLTREAMEADRARRAAEGEAELEQRASLALWRMDTELAPIIAEEVIRPPDEFRPKTDPVQPPKYVLAQFEAHNKGPWLSPQHPHGLKGQASLLFAPIGLTSYRELVTELPDAPLPLVSDAVFDEPADAVQNSPPNSATSVAS